MCDTTNLRRLARRMENERDQARRDLVDALAARDEAVTTREVAAAALTAAIAERDEAIAAREAARTSGYDQALVDFGLSPDAEPAGEWDRN
jgi:hypothetical protein